MLNHALRARAAKAYASNVVFVGAASGQNSATMPTHQVGDLIILQIVRLETSSAAVTNPGGYTIVPATGGLGIEQSGSGIYGRKGYYYKVATTTSEVTGTWTGASVLTAIVVRGQHATPFGGVATGNNSFASATVDFPTITIAAVKRANMLLGIVACRSASLSLETPPTNMQNVHNAVITGTHEAAIHTLKIAGSWPTTTVNYSGGTGAIYATVLEILSS